jgi:flagellar protein FlgJ
MNTMLPGIGPASALDLPVAAQKKTSKAEKARAAAEDFESVFLNSMFNQMFTGIDGEGPFGGAAGVGVWRSFLTDEYAKSFAKAGGVGIADHVYRTLLGQQEVAGR